MVSKLYTLNGDSEEIDGLYQFDGEHVDNYINWENKQIWIYHYDNVTLRIKHKDKVKYKPGWGTPFFPIEEIMIIGQTERDIKKIKSDLEFLIGFKLRES